jgi:hypothetical protein
MRWVVGAAVVAALGAACIWPAGAGDRTLNQLPPTAVGRPESSLIGLSFAAGEKLQQVTVIDPRKRAMCVYHIDATTGKIELKSVRSLEWDLEMIQFNGVDPLPAEIRSVLEQHR